MISVCINPNDMVNLFHPVGPPFGFDDYCRKPLLDVACGIGLLRDLKPAEALTGASLPVFSFMYIRDFLF